MVLETFFYKKSMLSKNHFQASIYTEKKKEKMNRKAKRKAVFGYAANAASAMHALMKPGIFKNKWQDKFDAKYIAEAIGIETKAAIELAAMLSLCEEAKWDSEIFDEAYRLLLPHAPTARAKMTMIMLIEQEHDVRDFEREELRHEIAWNVDLQSLSEKTYSTQLRDLKLSRLGI